MKSFLEKSLFAAIATKNKILSLSVLLLSAASYNVQATILDFSYTLQNGDILSGTFNGALEADGNTFRVSDVLEAKFNGNLSPELTFTDSISNLWSGSGLIATVALDGSFMDIAACTSSDCADGFVFDTSYDMYGFAVVVSYGGFEQYAASNWSASIKDVPEPATIVLLGLGLVGVGLARRKKSA